MQYPKVQQQLIKMFEEDQAAMGKLASNPDDKDLQREAKRVINQNTAKLKDIIAKIGWPSVSKVGKKGAHAAWLIAQHSDDDLEFQKRALSLMKNEGKDEVNQIDRAYFEDRVLVNSGKKQIYGTQLTQKDGELVPEPIKDEANVNKRRESVGLEPLAEYIRASNLTK